MFLRTFGLQKKITFCLLLSGVLLLLFSVNLSNCCYAYKYEFTADDIRSIRIYYNDNISWAGNFRAKTLEYQEIYDVVVINIVKTNSTNTTPIAYVYGFNKNNIVSISDANNINYMQISLNSGTGKRWSSSNNTETTVSVGYFYTGAQLRNMYSVWNNDLTSSVSGPVQLGPTILTFSEYYTYIYNVDLNDIYIDEDFPNIKQLSKYYNSYIAEFGQTMYFDGATLTYWKYEKDRGYFEPIFVKDVSSYSIINNDLGELYLFSSDFIPNTIMQYTLGSNNEEFSSLGISFYAVDSNTIITSGDLDIDNTFNDVYYDKYNRIINNMLNTSGGTITDPSGDITGYIDLEPIKNSIDNLTDSSQVDSVLDGYSTSGEILGLLNYQTYGSGDHRYFSAPVTYLFDSISNVLTSSGDVYFDIPLRNGTYKRIYSRDFYVPENGFKSFVRIFMIFSVIFTIYNHFKILIEDVNAGDGFKSLKRESVDTNIIHM